MRYIKVSETVYNDDGTVKRTHRTYSEEEFANCFPFTDINSLREGEVIEDLYDRYITVVEIGED